MLCTNVERNTDLTSLYFFISCVLSACALKCYDCIGESSENCNKTTECIVFYSSCFNQLSTSPIYNGYTLAAGSSKVDVTVKTCAGFCDEGSFSTGVGRNFFTTKCCSSDLCNTEISVGNILSLNGKKCFYCDQQNCKKTHHCYKNEDFCFSATVNSEGAQATAKGCISKFFCQKPKTVFEKGFIRELNCCQGDFCNSTSSTSASFLLLVALLISANLLS
uniref:Snake toxin/toxin-like domain-containing protein n=1 Tax=Maylandia zebra TaxID=106582 RepID=A0A3P9C4T0_9CICH